MALRGCSSSGDKADSSASIKNPAALGSMRAQRLGRSMRAVRGRERVVDVVIADTSQTPRERFVVALFLRMKAHVLEQQNIAVVQLGDGAFRRIADAVVGERDAHAETIGERPRHGPQREPRIRLPVGSAQVRYDDRASAVLVQPAQRRNRCVDATEVEDAAVRERYVEILAHQHALTPNVELFEPSKAHVRSGAHAFAGMLVSTIAVSSASRHE